MVQQSSETFSDQKKIKNSGNKFIKLIKELVREGNRQHFIIRNTEGRVLAELTVIIAVIIVLAAPLVSAIGLIAVLIRGCKIVIRRVDI